MGVEDRVDISPGWVGRQSGHPGSFVRSLCSTVETTSKSDGEGEERTGKGLDRNKDGRDGVSKPWERKESFINTQTEQE